MVACKISGWWEGMIKHIELDFCRAVCAEMPEKIYTVYWEKTDYI